MQVVGCVCLRHRFYQNYFNDAAHTGRNVYNDVWIDCRYDSKFTACCGANGEGNEEIMD